MYTIPGNVPCITGLCFFFTYNAHLDKNGANCTCCFISNHVLSPFLMIPYIKKKKKIDIVTTSRLDTKIDCVLFVSAQNIREVLH